MKCGDDLVQFMIGIVRHAGLENSFTENLAEQMEQQLYAEYSGQAVYIPKVPSRRAREARRDAVLREFNGRNRKEVCGKHGLSKAQFYRMLKGG